MRQSKSEACCSSRDEYRTLTTPLGSGIQSASDVLEAGIQKNKGSLMAGVYCEVVRCKADAARRCAKGEGEPDIGTGVHVRCGCCR